MQYRKKVTVCDLIPFTGGRTGLPDDLVLKSWPDGRHAVWNALHGSDIHLKVGDFINVTTPGDYYPITADVVAAIYEPVEAPSVDGSTM